MEQVGQELVGVLTAGVQAAGYGGNAPDVQKTMEVTHWLQQRSKDPTVNLCLAMVAGAAGQIDDMVRSQAALALKNNIKRGFSVAIKPNLAQIQVSLLAGLAEQNDDIRRAMASGVSEVARAGGVAALGQLLSQLWQQLQQATAPQARLGCLVSLRNICEDCVEELAQAPAAGQPAVGSALMPQMVQMLGTTADAAKASPSGQTVTELKLVLDCLQYLMDDSSGELDQQAQQHTQNLLSGLQKAMAAIDAIQTAGGGEEARKLQIATVRSFKLLTPHYALLKQGGVLQAILPMISKFTASEDNDTALAACEFWKELSENPLAVSDIMEIGMIGQLVEQLLNKMCYSQLELSLLKAEEERSDVKPMLPRRRGEDEEADDDEEVLQWTVRDCAGLTLDNLASIMGDKLINPPGLEPQWLLKTLIQPRLVSTDYLQTEAAVLALGAIATGCTSSLIPHLPGLIQHLMQLVADTSGQHFIVRSMACWTLSRYSKQIVYPEHDPASRQCFQAYLQLILGVMTDHTSPGARTVQHRSLTSFALLVEASGAVICEPDYLGMITQAIAPCLQPASHASDTNPRGFTTRNVCILLDSIGLLIRHAGADLATPETQQRIFDPLFGQLLPATPDDNAHLLPRVLQLVHITLVSLGDHAWQYVPSLFQRCLSFVVLYIQKQKAYVGHASQEPPDITCAWWGLEIAAAVVEWMGHSYPAEVEQLCLRCTLPQQTESICQCALVMISDQSMGCDPYLVRQVMNFLASCLQKFPAELVEHSVNISSNLIQYCNNDDEMCIDTCWFLGVVVATAGAIIPDRVAGLLLPVAERMAAIVHESKWTALLVQSAAICLGRCGLVHPQLGQQLPSFAEGFIRALGRSRADPEGKLQAFQGLLKMLQVNLAALQSPAVLTAFFVAIADFDKRDSDTTQGIVGVIQQLKGAAGAQWAQILPLVPVNTPADLRSVIGT